MNFISRAIASKRYLSTRKSLTATLRQSSSSATRAPKSAVAPPPRASGVKFQQQKNNEEKPKTQEPTHYFFQVDQPKSRDFPKPSEIPWQAKVANSVNLIGHVQTPVKFIGTPDGKYRAGTLFLCHSLDGSTFSIPVVFEGDLAHVAVCHLKEKDRIYVNGGLSDDPLPVSLGKEGACLHVLADSMKFVRAIASERKSSTKHSKQEECDNCDGHGEDSSIRKGNSRAEAAIEQKDYSRSASSTDDELKNQESWRELVKNPKQWWDYREKKLNGSVKAKHPDFKYKGSGTPLWLNRAPAWVHPGLHRLEFDVNPNKRVKANKKEDSWMNLVENPRGWWDNRSTKTNQKGPDFKHKDSREALWLSNAPDWVSSKLPPLQAK